MRLLFLFSQYALRNSFFILSPFLCMHVSYLIRQCKCTPQSKKKVASPDPFIISVLPWHGFRSHDRQRAFPASRSPRSVEARQSEQRQGHPASVCRQLLRHLRRHLAYRTEAAGTAGYASCRTEVGERRRQWHAYRTVSVEDKKMWTRN